MSAALYGAQGFYRRPEGPAGHFRTAAVNPIFAAALVSLLARVDAELGQPNPLQLVDVGAGHGELLRALHRYADRFGPRLSLVGVELADRPPDLEPEIGWVGEIPVTTGLLVANEWLDVVPLDVVELTGAGPRLVEVDDAGVESLGGRPTAADLRWLDRWWPLRRLGERADIGHPRDEAWRSATARVERGLAVAIDYSHAWGARPAYGTLTGYRGGRQVRPVPDGSCDLTAHVALDSCAEPGDVLTAASAALRELGISDRRPPLALASSDPAAYRRALQVASDAAELTDPHGLGGFGWLVCARDCSQVMTPVTTGA